MKEEITKYKKCMSALAIICNISIEFHKWHLGTLTTTNDTDWNLESHSCFVRWTIRSIRPEHTLPQDCTMQVFIPTVVEKMFTCFMRWVTCSPRPEDTLCDRTAWSRCGFQGWWRKCSPVWKYVQKNVREDNRLTDGHTWITKMHIRILTNWRHCSISFIFLRFNRTWLVTEVFQKHYNFWCVIWIKKCNKKDGNWVTVTTTKIGGRGIVLFKLIDWHYILLCKGLC